MQAIRESDWLCSPGEYQDLVARLSAADPRLRRDDKALRQKTPWPNINAKLVILEADTNGTFGAPVDHDAASLKTYLEERAKSPQHGHLRRVLILEGLHPDYISILGAHFKIHPAVFLQHERVIVDSPKTTQDSDSLGLPSTAAMATAQSCTMKYFELFALPERTRGIFKLSCTVTGRHIGVTRARGEFLDVGILRRKCSVWRSSRPNGPGWDCKLMPAKHTRA